MNEPTSVHIYRQLTMIGVFTGWQSNVEIQGNTKKYSIVEYEKLENTLNSHEETILNHFSVETNLDILYIFELQINILLAL